MASVGRNDRCPCGSGKKYKVCCLDKGPGGEPVPPEELPTPRDALRARLLTELAEFGGRFHPRVLKEGRELFPRPDDFEDDDGYPYPTEPDDELEWMARMLSAVFFDLPASPAGEVIAELYLKRMSSRLLDDERAWLTEMLLAPLTPYEVLEVEPDLGFKARNLWTGEEITVVERSGTNGLNVWDIVVARLAHEDGHRILEAGFYQFHAVHKPMIEELMLEYRQEAGLSSGAESSPHQLRLFSIVVHDFWIDLVLESYDFADPLTPEGDPVEHTEECFDVRDEKAMKRALRRRGDIVVETPSMFLWCEPDGEGGERILARIFLEASLLTLATRSRTRAARCQAMLMSIAPGSLTPHPDDTAWLDDAEVEESVCFDDARVTAGFLGEVPVDGLSEFMENHYRGWIDRPLPRLEGETPRDAVLTSAGRVEVVNLLKEMENSHGMRELPPYDFRWMWKDLRLSRS